MNNRSFDWQAEQIVQNNSDPIMFADHEGLIRLWNKGAEVMFGYSADEAEGNSLDLIRGENGAVLGTGAVIRDITARFQKEKALKERLKVLEGDGTR
jgi:nitrogen fixation/metabolism regulation signal transduction histidine kinase